MRVLMRCRLSRFTPPARKTADMTSGVVASQVGRPVYVDCELEVAYSSEWLPHWVVVSAIRSSTPVIKYRRACRCAHESSALRRVAGVTRTALVKAGAWQTVPWPDYGAMGRVIQIIIIQSVRNR